MMRDFQLKLPEQIYDDLEQEHKRLGVSRAEIARRALVEHLEG